MSIRLKNIMPWKSILRAGLIAVMVAAVTPLVAYAQRASSSAAVPGQVTGVVLDETGEPLIGATVMVKGTTNGATTDLDGNFSIKASKGATLVVSYVGYNTQEVKAVSGNMNIKLKPNDQVLDELVVVGYGVQKKASMTGSVTVVNDEKLKDKGALASPVEALQGQVPGVIITRSSSAPGEENWDMKIRGSVSKNNSAPLVIIDGIEYEGVGALNQLNPSDIESMNILKDAAASIYGSKAAGGVVLITTKKGKDDQVRVEYNGSYTHKFVGNTPKTMSIDEWADAQIEAYLNDGDPTNGWITYAKMMKEYKGQFIDMRNGNPLNGMFSDTQDLTFFDTDWNDVIWGDSWSTNHDLAVSGGKNGNTYRVSAAYMYDDSPLKWGNNHNNRFNIRLNNTFKFHKRFSLTSSIALNRQDQVSPTQIGACLSTSTAQPGFPTSTIDGKPYGWGTWRAPNWAAELGGDNRYKALSVNVSEAFRYDIIDGLSLNAVFGYNYRGNTRDAKTLSVDYYNYKGDTKVFSNPSQDDTKYEKWWDRRELFMGQGYLDYTKTWKDVHNFKAMLGVQYSFTDYESNTNTAMDINAPLEVVNGTGTITTTGAKWQEALLSYYGRVNYDFDSRYLLEGQARYDGSSKFQAENRWAFFWGVSAGWRIGQEKFMEATRSWLSELKLRASYGNVGNQNGIDRYSGVALYNFKPNQNVIIGNGKVSWIDTNGKLVSLDRTWERVHNYNVALDFGFFNNRLTGSFEAYWKRVDNMLIDVIYPAILGDSAPTANKGKFKAWGYDANINWNHTVGNVTYHIGGTFTYADNKLLDNGGSGAIQAGVRSDREGYPLNSVWGYRYCGKIQNEEQLKKYIDRYNGTSTVNGNISKLRVGDNMFEDVNKDGKLTFEDLVYLGSEDPKIQFSFNFGATWKGLDIDFVFQGAGRRTVWRRDGNNNADIWRIPTRTAYMNGSNHFIGNVWSESNPDGYYTPLTHQQEINNYNYQCSSWSVEDGSYLRLKNVTIGYTLPQNILNRQKVLSGVRVYLTGTDLWETSKIKDGWDPESSGKVSNANRYPFLRSLTVGLHLTF